MGEAENKQKLTKVLFGREAKIWLIFLLMEIVNLNVFARNLKATTCRIEIKSRTYKRADYGKGEKYNVIHLTKMR